MKNIFKITIGLIALFLIAACSSDKEAVDTVNNNLNPTNVGYGSEATLSLDGEIVNSKPRFDIVSKKGNILTVDVFVPIPEEKSFWVDNISSQFDKFKTRFIDKNGNLKKRMRFANNESELSFINNWGMKRPIIKYDEAVGAEWSFSTLSGKKIVSKVIYKSEKEDFPYGLSKIKVIKTEVNSTVKGVTKFVSIANRDFGLVGADVYLEDGTVLNVRKK